MGLICSKFPNLIYASAAFRASRDFGLESVMRSKEALTNAVAPNKFSALQVMSSLHPALMNAALHFIGCKVEASGDPTSEPEPHWVVRFWSKLTGVRSTTPAI